MKDPRDAGFYKLRKREPSQLSAEEARYVQTICERMMAFVRDGKTRKSWEQLASLYARIVSRSDGPDW